jgi:acyl transferase domain-containing protein/NAD(P)-dependent dehydrogenase (short-subunit alcohol dehydrogenase family)/acyl carrier protein
MNNTKYTGLEIAIVGMSGRFPGAKNIDEFWENVREGRESLSHFSDEQLLANGADAATIASPDYVKTGCIVEGKHFFDSNFFNYTPSEAAMMDPQIRVFHECVWEALEDTCGLNKMKNIPVGLFAGASENFVWRAYTMLRQEQSEMDDFRASQLNDAQFINTLVSYKLDLKGPAIYINTACSTSLVAVHMACRSLLTGDSKIAIAGGVAMNSTKKQGYLYQADDILSKDGHCKAFNTDSSGTMGGQGAGVVVLKKLQDAVKDGDRIYAVIKGSAINNDGNRKVGYTAPSADGQAECIRVAHKMAKIDPESIGYIEAHGTATKLGDPIEALALQKIFKNGKPFSAAIGAVKSNIGHLDAAAGISGLIKTTLMLWHKKIPPVVYANEPIPELSWGDDGFYLNTKLKEWERKAGYPLCAGVSAFGIGGTNAHVVLEEAPLPESSAAEREHKLITISAKTEKSLKRYQQDLLDFILKNPQVSLSDMSYTLQTGRKHFAYRKSIAFNSYDELAGLLMPDINEQLVKSRERGNAVVFMFSGAGSQYANMGRSIYENEAVFREEMDKGFTFLKEITGIDYSKIIYPVSESDSQINEMLHTQPMIFLFGYSLARLIISYGIQPECMIGHSIGEYVAACISGVFTFEDALRLVVKRGELMNRMLPGAMLSVSIKEEEAQSYLNHKLSIAAVNAPEQVVFSGDTASIDELIKMLDAEGTGHVKLYASHAGHSVMIEDILEDYTKAFGNISFNLPTIPFVSNLTGKEIRPDEAMSVDYWLRHMRETVKFSEGIKELLNRKSEKIFIEIGGGHSLSSLLRQQQTGGQKPIAINLVRHPKEPDDDLKYLTAKIGQLWMYGAEPNWISYYKNEQRRKISLPTYSFEKIKYPAEVNPFENGSLPFDKLLNATGKNNDLKNWIYYPVWKNSILNIDETNELRGYVIFSPVENTSSDSILANLAKYGDSVIEVLPGTDYKKESANRYIINPVSEEDYLLLFADLEKEKVLITDVIHAWSINIHRSEIEWNEKNEALSRVYFSLAFIAKGLLQVNNLNNISITAITGSLHNVLGGEKTTYSSSLLLGILNVLSKEYSVNTNNIDIDNGNEDQDTGEKVAREIRFNKTDRLVSFRNGKRWVLDYQQQPGVLQNKKCILKKGSLIVITGGFGNIGLVFLNHLIKKHGCRIAVIGRRKVDALMEDKLNILNREGEVFYYQSDVINKELLKDTVSEIEQKHGEISGIIHAAGVTDINYCELIEDITIEKTLAMFAPKVQGVENIYTVFKGKSLDFVFLTSSLASVLGQLSFSSYSAANLFMDHFVLSKGNELSNWKSLNICETVFTDEDIKYEAEAKRTALLPQDLCELFDWSIGVKEFSQVVISVKDLYKRLDDLYGRKGEMNLTEGFNEDTVEKLERPDLKNGFVAPETETEKKLASMIESFFRIDRIGIEDSFFELGGDSLKAVVLLNRIKKEMGVALTVKDFFVNPTVKALASEIDEIKVLLAPTSRAAKIII